MKKKYDTAHIRNIALVGSKGVGKTTAVEALLFSAKATTRLGRVDEGNSDCPVMECCTAHLWSEIVK